MKQARKIILDQQGITLPESMEESSTLLLNKEIITKENFKTLNPGKVAKQTEFFEQQDKQAAHPKKLARSRLPKKKNPLPESNAPSDSIPAKTGNFETCFPKLVIIKKLFDQKGMNLEKFVTRAWEMLKEEVATPPESMEECAQLLLNHNLITKEQFNTRYPKTDSAGNTESGVQQTEVSAGSVAALSKKYQANASSSDSGKKTLETKPPLPPKPSNAPPLVDTVPKRAPEPEHQTAVAQHLTGSGNTESGAQQTEVLAVSVAAQPNAIQINKKPASSETLSSNPSEKAQPSVNSAPQEETQSQNPTLSSASSATGVGSFTVSSEANRYWYEDDLSSFGPREQKEYQSIGPEDMEAVKKGLAGNAVIEAAIRTTENAKAANKIAEKAAKKAKKYPSAENILAANKLI